MAGAGREVPNLAALPMRIHRFPTAPLALLLLLASPLLGQTGAVQQAIELRDRREFAEAAAVLRRQVAGNPRDSEAARLLAQTLYWMGDVDGARAGYRDALARFPGDTPIRLEYARLLAETGDRGEARRVLVPLRGTATEAEAEALLGTIAYWEGDLSTAVRHFRGALDRVPGHAEAQRQLDEIRAATGPWATIGGTHRSDDQPLSRTAGRVELGMHPAPAQRLSVRFEPQRYTESATAEVVQADVLWEGYLHAARLEVAAGAGVFDGGIESGREWTAQAAAGFRLPLGGRLRARLERAPYQWTPASVVSPLLTETTGVLVALDRGGWFGEAGTAVQRFPDDNRITSAYGWLLAPLVRSGGAMLQAGYGFGAQDAEESRFLPSPTPLSPGRLAGRFLPSSPPQSSRTYGPYYTPDDQRVHSALVAVTLPLSPRAVIRIGGGYGFDGRELAPASSPGEPPVERSYRPWDLRGSADVALPAGLSLLVGGERSRTAFYEMTLWTAALTFRPARR